MNLLQAFEETIGGKEDRSGITMVDVYVSKIGSSTDHSQQEKAAELQSVVEAQLPDEERKWFLLSGVVSKWGLTSEVLSESIRRFLANNVDTMSPMARYHGFRAMGLAGNGLLPDDILGEVSMRTSAPKLWVELFLNAYQNGNPIHITNQLIELVQGTTPLMSWKSLRAILPEMRVAYGSSGEFRKQIKIIASKLQDAGARKGLLEAADKRVGGGISDSVVALPKRPRVGKIFSIPPQTIKRDIDYSRKNVSTDGQLAIATG